MRVICGYCAWIDPLDLVYINFDESEYKVGLRFSVYIEITLPLNEMNPAEKSNIDVCTR